MQSQTIIEADLTWLNHRFEPNVQIVISADGMIEHVGNLGEKPTRRMRRQAIIPGFVNAHSHAFQRGLRGLGEHFPSQVGSFWSWREAMYKLVETMTADSIYELSCRAFREMLRAGMTTVGEFHYLHHDESNQGYAFDDVILKAAEATGIRLVLLNVYYATGGIHQPLEPAQRRFGSESTEVFFEQMDRLSGSLTAPTQTLGMVVHSIRAAELEDLVTVHEEAIRRKMVLHMHVEEQQKELNDCIQAYGKAPMALLNERLQLDSSFTAVHCTHSSRQDLDEFLGAGANVCLCPMTEANLGDGIPRLSAMQSAGGHLCLGTDSNLRISMHEEMRLMEYVQRLRHECRGVLRDRDGKVSTLLMHAATEGGARALGVQAGSVQPGLWADFAAIDLDSPLLAGTDADSLLDALVFGCGNEPIIATCVGGQWLDLT
ncbi:MAG: formimidoylglutamate deiminase [Phycisphaerae bacterium]